jgi:hypothetical protein
MAKVCIGHKSCKHSATHPEIIIFSHNLYWNQIKCFIYIVRTFPAFKNFCGEPIYDYATND